MSACERFDSEGLARWAHGQAPDAHVASCPDCQARWRALDRLGSALRYEPPVSLPGPQWKARVLAGADAAEAVPPARPPERSRRAWLVWTAPSLAIAALGLLYVRRREGSGVLPEPSVDFAVVAAEGRRVRGQAGVEPLSTTGAVGDRLKVFGALPAGVTWEVRTYRENGGLVFRCPPGCERANERFEVDIPLSAAGRYRTVVVVSRHALPPPAGGPDADRAGLEKAGGRVRELPVIDVK